MLASAVIYGLSAAFPPIGAVAIPLYTVYGYSRLGLGLYKVYKEWREHSRISEESMRKVAGPSAEAATQSAADKAALAVANQASRIGLFDEMAKKTGVDPVVMKEMVRGSTSSALSTSAGELAKFAIKKAVGA